MKTIALSLIVLTLSVASASAQVIVNDPSLTVPTSVPGSSVALGSNGLVLTDGGAILTTTSYPTDVQIDVSFAFTGTDFDSFKITTRTDGSITSNNDGQFDSGIRASFRMMSDTYDTWDNIELDDVQFGSQYVVLGLATMCLTEGQVYNVEMDETDTGVSLSVDGDPLINAFTTSSYGGQIGLDNREGEEAGSWISEGSQVTVSAFSVTDSVDPTNLLSTVPEGGMTGGWTGLSTVALLAFRRREQRLSRLVGV